MNLHVYAIEALKSSWERHRESPPAHRSPDKFRLHPLNKHLVSNAEDKTSGLRQNLTRRKEKSPPTSNCLQFEKYTMLGDARYV